MVSHYDDKALRSQQENNSNIYLVAKRVTLCDRDFIIQKTKEVRLSSHANFGMKKLKILADRSWLTLMAVVNACPYIYNKAAAVLLCQRANHCTSPPVVNHKKMKEKERERGKKT